MPLSVTELDPIAEKVKDELGEAVYNSWFGNVTYFVENERCLGVSVGTRFMKQRLESDYLHIIKSAIEYVTHKDHDILITLAKPTKKQIVKKMPEGERQYNLFLPVISEIPIKDDVHLMEIAPFTLQPRHEKRTRIHYNNIDGMDIEINAHQDYGLITHLDYDIVLMMQSNLAQAANIYRSQLKDYEERRAAGQTSLDKPEPPPRKFKPTVADIMEFTLEYDPKVGKRPGTNQIAVIEARLDRLKYTSTKIRRTNGRKRRIGTFSFIQDYRVVSETESGQIQEVEIDIPNWIYDGIVHSKIPTILTYDPTYFKIKSPTLRFLYRFLRLKVDKNATDPVKFDLEEIHRRSGSRQPIKEFNRTLTDHLSKEGPTKFFDYELELSGAARKRQLCAKTADTMSVN